MLGFYGVFFGRNRVKNGGVWCELGWLVSELNGLCSESIGLESESGWLVSELIGLESESGCLESESLGL